MHRLHLTLVSALAALPAVSLPTALGAVERELRGMEEGEERAEVVKALFEVMMEKVGDREKDITMRWWMEKEREGVLSGRGLLRKVDKGKGKQKEEGMTSRL